MKMTAIMMIVIMIFSNQQASYAQDNTLVLTLEEAILLAGERSADALIAKHRFRSNYWQYRSFKADYLPSVTLDANVPYFSRSYRGILQPDGTSKFQYNTFGDYSAGMTINQKVGPTGGSVFLRSSLQRHDDVYVDSTDITYQSTPIIIGYSQPIFKYNEYRWARQLEPLKYEKAKRQYLEDIEQVSITTTNYFFNLLLAQIEKGIAEKNLNSYDTLYKIALGRYQLGKIAENELLQLELNFLRAKAAVDNASLNYENMLFRLKSFLRIKETTAIELLPPTKTKHQFINTSQAIAEARKNTATSIEFKERLISAESVVRQAKMNGRFDADLYLEYGLTQSSSDVADVYTSPLDQQVVNLGVNVPILDWGKARGQIKVAESNFELEQT
jgi:outer membrane protein TolC